MADQPSQQPSQPQTVSDQQREKIAEEIAAALLLIYAGRRQQALRRLGIKDAPTEPPADAVEKINAFATDRAQKIQDGINSRMMGADDQQAMAQSIAQYNAQTLQPYMESWASHQGLLDAYQETPASEGTGTAAHEHLWQWSQVTNFEDDCQTADAMGPSPLDDLMSVTGGPPPVHENCKCVLFPTN